MDSENPKSVEREFTSTHGARAIFQRLSLDEFHTKVARTEQEITELINADFEYDLQKDGLAYFRKRK
jgi:hypothetical protein